MTEFNEHHLEGYLNIISELFYDYKDSEFVINKLNTHINGLPTLFKNMDEENKLRSFRRDELLKQAEIFNNSFLSENNYYYIPNTGLFIHYDDVNYKNVSEDAIYYAIFSRITENKNVLQSWKYKIKTHIIKVIKDTPIHSSIPESGTIQNVQSHLCPAIFKNKKYTKYFLTIIGDAILRKDDKNVYLVSTEGKDFLLNLSQQLYFILGKSYTDGFKYKYYEYEFSNCRILNIQSNNSEEILHFLKNNILNLISVCCYLSKKYGSADQFLYNHCNDTNIVNNTLFLKNNNQEDIVGLFIKEFTQGADKDIPYKNIYLLWKQFLQKYNLPFVISQVNFKKLLKQMNIYDDVNDICKNISSKESMDISYFQQFWDENIKITDENVTEDVFEIDEIYNIFNDWCKHPERKIVTYLNEDKMRELIIWINPDITIEDGKYVYNIRCCLWNKKTNIDLAIESLNNSSTKETNVLQKYKYYCKFVKQNSNNEIKASKYIVSKQYFEDYLSTVLTTSASNLSLLSLTSNTSNTSNN